MSTIDPVRVALVEDDDELRRATRQALELAGHEVAAFPDAESALSAIEPDFDGVVVSDIRMPRVDGLELFARLHERDAEQPVILVTGHGDVPMAVEAIKRGAADFLTKPFATVALVEAVTRAAAQRRLVIENRRLRDALRDRAGAGLLGTSEAIGRLDRLVREVARTDLDVHVAGGAGMGKSHLARRIHELSTRSERPFVRIDVSVWTNPDAELLVFGRDRAAGLSRSGLVERAQGGTLLLDDIEEIPETMRGQIRALFDQRTIRAMGADRPQNLDVRILAAKSGDDAADPANTSALLARLGGVAITIPSLDERREDVAVIFRHFVDEFEREFACSAPVPTAGEWTFVMQHEWPGGVRELRDFARNFVIGLSQVVRPAGAENGGETSLSGLTAAFEKAVLEDALRKTSGRVDDVQRLLSIKRKTLYDKLSRHGLHPRRFR